jgi:hypothetical protein
MPVAVPPAVAHASVIVTWNAGSPRPAATAAPRIFTGTLVTLKGRTAGVRMADGSLRYFTADKAQVAALHERLGYSISFIVK